MGLLSKLTKFVGGSLFSEIKETIKEYYPPDLSPLQKAELEQRIEIFLHQKELESNRILNEAAAQLDKRISQQEGTASDLKTIPILGHLLIFLRGAQRPVWGFATLYMDFKWLFEGGTFTEQQQTAMIVINILVLGFLFGERTIKNLEPLIIKVFGKTPS
jgi:hypothetical protein